MARAEPVDAAALTGKLEDGQTTKRLEAELRRLLYSWTRIPCSNSCVTTYNVVLTALLDCNTTSALELPIELNRFGNPYVRGPYNSARKDSAAATLKGKKAAAGGGKAAEGGKGDGGGDTPDPMPLLAEFKLLKKEITTLADKVKCVEQSVEQFSQEAMKEMIEGAFTKVKNAAGDDVLLAYKDGLKDGAELSSGKRFEPSRGRMAPPSGHQRSGSRASYERSETSTPSSWSRGHRDEYEADEFDR